MLQTLFFVAIVQPSFREQIIAKGSGSMAIGQEVENYLGTAAQTEAVLQFWQKAEKYPVLQRIARDFLGIPATSVKSERENSKARYIMTDQRNRLWNTSVQAT